MNEIITYIKILRQRCVEAHLKSMFNSDDYMYAYTEGFNDSLDELENKLEELSSDKKSKKFFSRF